MSEFLALGGGSTLYQPDALDRFAGSAESAVRVERQTKRVQPPDLTSGLPASESVFRRIFVKVTHTQGCSLTLTPYLDGAASTENKAYLSRPAPSGGSETYTFLVPLARTIGEIKVGLRGTSLAVDLASADPEGVCHVQSVIVAYEPISSLRGRRSNE